jgi:murein DD-endopeptidase MepM/ murein hydrolase activator NlpD
LPDVVDGEPIAGTDNEAIPVHAGTEASSVTSSMEFVMPVFGSVTFDYSMDQLTYSRTLEEWRVHSGMDIGATIGTPVACVADGTVTDIKNDPGFGFTVIVDHGNGYKTVYANLAREAMVEVNQIVKAGEVIGAVGDTALFECAEESHLHFEVWQDGKVVDPKNYLPME